MDERIFFLTICALLALVFAVSVYLSIKGNAFARSFLWTWALLLGGALLVLPLTPGRISAPVAALALTFFFYVLFLINRRGLAKLETAHEETRRVLAASSNRMDDERRAISRQLHDTVNPSLVLGKHELHKLASLLKDDAQAREIIERVTAHLTTAYQASRDIIKNTRIEVIDSIGLTAAIESLVDHYRSVFDKPAIELKHNLPKRPQLTDSVAVNMYRIIQEALFNAIKHADAKHVVVSIQHNKTFNRYDVEITDDGIGIKSRNPAAEGGGIGLIDMRERARILGAELKIQADASSGKKGGTKISFSISDRDSSRQT